MSYISKIREKVGHDPIISVGATVLVFNNKNEYSLSTCHELRTVLNYTSL